MPGKMPSKSRTMPTNTFGPSWEEKFMSNDSVRTSRGISRDVWEARPYVWWDKDDEEVGLDPIRKAYEGLTQGQVNFMLSLARQQPGWIINRHAVPHAFHVWPEIRPEDLVRTGPPTLHWHGDGEPTEFPNKGYSVLPCYSKAWKEHCDKINATDPDLEPDEAHERRQDPHRHENLAKYCFPPAEKRDEPWLHNHDWYYDKPARLRAHRKKHHAKPSKIREKILKKKGVEWPPEEIMEGEHKGKHVHTRRVKAEESLARRLDVHPMAAGRWRKARRIYFGIEGCLKADSILSAIRREDRPESVFSVPSVSLWGADEFDGFIPHLRGKTVIVLPDADWYKKRLVLQHARFAQRYLKNHGIRAYIAAPPLASGHKGVDDYLGDGGSLDELEVLDRHASPRLTAAFDFLWGVTREDGYRNARTALQDLAFFADEDGYTQFTHETMAKVLRVDRSTVANVLERLEGHEYIEVEQFDPDKEIWKETPVDRWTCAGYIDANGQFWPGPELWTLKTRVCVQGKLRSTNVDPYPLKELER
jgi:hypothetical protein